MRPLPIDPKALWLIPDSNSIAKKQKAALPAKLQKGDLVLCQNQGNSQTEKTFHNQLGTILEIKNNLALVQFPQGNFYLHLTCLTTPTTSTKMPK